MEYCSEPSKVFTQSCSKKYNKVAAPLRIKIETVLQKIWMIFLTCVWKFDASYQSGHVIPTMKGLFDMGLLMLSLKIYTL